MTRIELDSLEDKGAEDPKYILHVMIILVLEKYRKKKIGSFLMDWIN